MPQIQEVNSDKARQNQVHHQISRPAAELPAQQRDVLNHKNFGLLPESNGRLGSFGVSAGVNLAIIAVILLLTLNQVHEAHVKRQEDLVYVAPPPEPVKPPMPKVQMPPIPKLEPKIEPPKPVEPPKIELPKIVAPKPESAKATPQPPAPAPKPVVAPPKPAMANAFKSPEAPAAVAPKVATAQAAGFGAPTGLQANPQANRPSQLTTAGAFGASASQPAAARQAAVANAGFGSGAASGSPNGGARGPVASTGFGAGSQPAGTPGGHGVVASTGFGQGAPAGSGAAARVQQPVTTSIVVLAKPLPQYTAEARDAHIQGDVTLEVRFSADGQVEVLRVVNGLGHGLDEQAKLAAAKIRFKPATRDGKAIDQVSVIHVAFQLA